MTDKLIGDVIVMRGLPGIGKSNLAKRLAGIESWKPDQKIASVDLYPPKILSADDFFLSPDKKIYNFDKEKLEEAYKWNFKRFKDAIAEKVPLIIIDNTNIKHFHFWQYIDYAQRNNYRASVLTIPHNDCSDRELETRTPHGIPKGVIYKMRKEFEWELMKK